MISSIILAGGKGTRMKSEIPKVCHTILDYEMINYVIDNVKAAKAEKIYVIVGYKKEFVKEKIDTNFEVEFAVQEEQLGTAHAVMQLKDELETLEGDVIITFGDAPLIKSTTFQKLEEKHRTQKNDLTILTAEMQDPTGYGRIIRTGNDVDYIVEQKDATEEEQKVQEINSGVFCIKVSELRKYLFEITNDNSQEEYYLTDLIKIFRDNNLKVGALKIEDNEELTGVNDLIALEKVAKILQQQINRYHLTNGVNIMDSSNTYIGPKVTIGAGTKIYPGTTILNEVVVGTNNIIKANTMITDSIIGNNNEIGPMASLRDSVQIGDKCRIGNFVEMKKVTMGNESKAAHLAYLGDTIIGNNVNIGCGVITANYDGVNKHQTIIKDNAFIGSNVNLIAPIEIGENTFIAAGTTVTKPIEEDKFVIGRIRETIKEKK